MPRISKNQSINDSLSSNNNSNFEENNMLISLPIPENLTLKRKSSHNANLLSPVVDYKSPTIPEGNGNCNGTLNYESQNNGMKNSLIPCVGIGCYNYAVVNRLCARCSNFVQYK